MNDAQLFTIFGAILIFGWMGFFAGRGWKDASGQAFGELFITLFPMGSAGLFIATAINLIALVAKNF